MHLKAHLNVDSVAIDTADTITVLLDLQAPAAVEAAEPRPEHTAVVVLDRSASMAGSRLDAAKAALTDLVAQLDDRDRFGLIAFDHDARVVVPAGRVGDIGRERLRRDIATVDSGGTTDLSSGYLRGLQEAKRVCGATGATVMLVSDGHANRGVVDPERLRDVAAKAAKDGLSTSTIGIGLDYDESILVAVAEGGSGNHAFAEHADAAAAAVAAELEGLLSKSVQAASLLISPTSDVASVQILNPGLPAVAVEGGLLVDLGDFYSGEARKLVLTFAVPASARLGLAQIGTLTLKYVELPALDEHTVTVPVTVNVVPGDAAAGRVPDPVVEREVLLLTAHNAKRSAARALSEGDRAAAAGHIRAARKALAEAPQGLVDDEISTEADWLTTTASFMDSREAAYNAKRLWADQLRKSRGYKNRTQGGEIDEPENGS